MTIGGGITAGAGTDAALANRGPDGSSESSPRPNALRFSAGLCSSIALIQRLQSKYVVLRYNPNSLVAGRRSSGARQNRAASSANVFGFSVRRTTHDVPRLCHPFKSIVI